MTDEALFIAESDGISFALFGDRIEVTNKKRRQTLALSSVTEVYVSRRPRKLVVVTSDGKQYQYLLGHEIEAARAAVAGELRRLAPSS